MGGCLRALLVIVTLTCSMTLLGAPSALADVSASPADTYVTNGPVHAIATTPTTTYIGGQFTEVGPRTGPGVGIDATSGKSVDLPEVSGGYASVDAVARDDSGGFFIGGNFTHVGGIARNNLAHIRADGSVDPGFAPNPDNAVYALVVSGSTLYVGGHFLSIGGQSSAYIAAIDVTTGRVTGWDPKPNDQVFDLAVSGSTVYAGGWFNSIGGQSRNGIAAIDAATGKATGWDPKPSGVGLTISALAVAGPTVYVGGYFSSIGGQSRNGIAAIDAATGKATGWDPNPTYDDSTPAVSAIAVSGSTVYLGGLFRSIGGEARDNIAAIDAATGKATAWDPDPSLVGTFVGTVGTLAVSGSTVYVGGDFDSIGGERRNHIAAIDATSGKATAWDPNADGLVGALAVSGSRIYAGGFFRSIGGEARDDIAAIDAATGKVTSWAPEADPYSTSVTALAVPGSTVYVGGEFSSVGGQVRNNIAAIDAVTGQATDWDPNVGGQVSTLAVAGSTVYAGGSFRSIGTEGRNDIAAIDAATGKATRWDPNADGRVSALTVSGPTVYAGGDFSTIGGQSRNGIAAVDAETGKAMGWDPHPNAGARVSALAVSGRTVYAGGTFNSIGESGNNLAGIDAVTGKARPWFPHLNAGAEIYALAVSPSTVYVGGAFTSIGGRRRNDIGAIDAVTGKATGWNPNADSFITTLAVGADGTLYAGGDFHGFDLAPQSGFAAFPRTEPSNAFELSKPKLNRRTGAARLTARVPGPGTLVLRGRGITKVRKRAEGTGTVRLKVRAAGRARKTLKRKGSVTVKARVTFTPTGGSPASDHTTVRLVRKPSRP